MFVTPDEFRAFRKSRGISQAKSALAVGVATRTVEEWEAGRRAIPTLAWFAIHYINSLDAIRSLSPTLRVFENGVDVTESVLTDNQNRLLEYEATFTPMSWVPPPEVTKPAPDEPERA